jgi:hypothetical protein
MNPPHLICIFCCLREYSYHIPNNEIPNQFQNYAIQSINAEITSGVRSESAKEIRDYEYKEIQILLFVVANSIFMWMVANLFEE